MSLYAIGDLHLHFETELKSKNQIEDNKTKEYEVKKREEKIKKKIVENRKLDKIIMILLYHFYVI